MTKPPEPKPSPGSSPIVARSSLLAILAAQLVLVALFGWQARYDIHPDAVCYLRIARYVAEGNWPLSVSGYWGPLLSWLAAPLLAAGCDPLVAGRVVAAAASFVLTLGAANLFAALNLRPPLVVAGTCVTALAAAVWSAEWITPDVLLAGLLALACARLLGAAWTERLSTAWLAGLLFGLAYLAKAVALPASVLMVAGMACLAVWWRQASPMRVMATTATTLAGMAVVAAPWIGVLSWKQGAPTLSTSAAISHALVGPPDVPRMHPHNSMLVAPEAGRLTASEDSSTSAYPHWSPLASRSNVRHQALVILRNARSVVSILSQMDVLRLSMFPLLIGFVVAVGRRQPPTGSRWMLAALPVGCLAAIYLPVYANEIRYFYAALPLLLAAALGMVDWISDRSIVRNAPPAAPEGRATAPSASRAVARWCISLVIVSFLVPYAWRAAALIVRPAAMPAWREFAASIAREEAGPVAGDTFDALYAAFYADRPFLGLLPSGAPDDFAAGGAKIVVLDAGGAVVQQFARDSRWREIAAQPPASDARRTPPIRVFVKAVASVGRSR